MVIGAGPAGLMAAATAAARGLRTALLEKNDQVGRKLRLSGGGNGNISPDVPLDRFIREMGPSGPFLRSALAAFGSELLEAFCAELGLRLECDQGRRLVRGGSAAFTEAMVRHVREVGARLILSRPVQNVRFESSGGFYVSTAEGDLEAATVVIAAGGRSYPRTGSSGDGFELARRLGHSVVAPMPALGPVRLAEGVFAGLAGVSVPRVECQVLADGKVRGRFAGAMLTTHTGLSGPAVLDASLVLARELRDGRKAHLRIDLLPGLERERIETALRDQPPDLAVLADLPQRLVRRLLELAGADLAARTLQLTRPQRHRLVELVKANMVAVADTGSWETAMVTEGGVSLKEIDPRTMQSRAVPGLFLAGEVIDAAGPCGGYNIHVALATGRLAGDSVGIV